MAHNTLARWCDCGACCDGCGHKLGCQPLETNPEPTTATPVQLASVGFFAGGQVRFPMPPATR